MVGATYPAELAAALRRLMPEVIFSAARLRRLKEARRRMSRPAFRPDGLAAIVSSSRGLLFPLRAGRSAQRETHIEEATRAAIAALAACGPQSAMAGVAQAMIPLGGQFSTFTPKPLSAAICFDLASSESGLPAR